MDLVDEVVRRDPIRNSHHERRLTRVGEHGELAEDDDIGIGHLGAEHVDKAFGLRDVVAGHLECSAVVLAHGRVISNQEDAGRTSAGAHGIVIIYS